MKNKVFKVIYDPNDPWCDCTLFVVAKSKVEAYEMVSKVETFKKAIKKESIIRMYIEALSDIEHELLSDRDFPLDEKRIITNTEGYRYRVLAESGIDYYDNTVYAW